MEKSTGFRCAMITSIDQSLDLLVPSKVSAAALQSINIQGLLQVSVIDKKAVKAGYDRTVIGARALLDGLDILRRAWHLRLMMSRY